MKTSGVIDWLRGGSFELLDLNMLTKEESGQEDKKDSSKIEPKNYVGTQWNVNFVC